jgi:predicted transcriptional regulator YdeE
MQETIAVELVEVAPFKAIAVRTGMTPDKSGTRIAWSKLTEVVPLDDARLAIGPSAFVFIEQRQWGNEVDTLWVGLKVNEFGDMSDSLETLEVSGGLCVSATVNGDEAHMWRVYETIFSWIDQSSEYELDKRDGVLGMETVPLEPINSLTVPYAELENYNFTMLYPVRRKSEAK